MSADMCRRVFRVIGCAATALLVAGASTGCRHVITPLDLDFDRTVVQESGRRGDVKHVRYQLAEVKWDSNGIGDIARQHGMETVYYADLETLAIFGLFTQETVHVYGR